MDLSVKEKEKYILELHKLDKIYRDLKYEVLISPREINKILKNANGENEEKEKKNLIVSNTSNAL